MYGKTSNQDVAFEFTLIICNHFVDVHVNKLLERYCRIDRVDFCPRDTRVAGVKVEVPFYCALIVDDVFQQEAEFRSPFLLGQERDVSFNSRLVVMANFGDYRCAS